MPKMNQKFLRERALSISSLPEISAANPIINETLIMFAPIISPKEKSGTPPAADDNPMKSSGMEVAIPARINEREYSETRNNLAKFVIALTRVVLVLLIIKNEIMKIAV